MGLMNSDTPAKLARDFEAEAAARRKKQRRKWFWQKMVITPIAIVVCALPTEIWFFIRWLFGPEGFWQEIALFGIGVIFFGVWQLLMIFFFFAFVVEVLLD